MHHCSAWMLIEWVQFRQSVSNYSYIVFISTPIRSSSQTRSLPLSVGNLVRSQLGWWKDDGRQWKQFNELWWLMRHPGWLEERMLAVQMQLLAILNMISNSLYSSKVYSFLCRHLLAVFPSLVYFVLIIYPLSESTLNIQLLLPFWKFQDRVGTFDTIRVQHTFVETMLWIA